MYSKGKLWLAAGSLMAATALVIPHDVLAAVADRIETKKTIERGTNAGQSGYWVQLDETTYRWTTVNQIYLEIFPDAKLTDQQIKDLTDLISSGKMTTDQLKANLREMKRLLSYDGRPVAGQAGPLYLGGSAGSRPNDGWWGDFGGKTINFESIDRMIGRNWSSKKSWLVTYGNWTNTPIYTNQPIGYVAVIPNTTSSFIEVSRLAQLIELMDKGLPLPYSTIPGYHLAYDTAYPYTVAATRAALLAKANEIFNKGIDTWSPIALDLNQDGKIGVTGKSTAAYRKPENGFVMTGSVLFDLRAVGKRERFEWLDRSGDGFLVFDRGGEVSKAAAKAGDIDGTKLFGNVVGYDHGYQKLALFTSGIHVASKDLKSIPARVAELQAVKGDGLKDLKIWIDENQDGRVQPGELKTLAALGITEIGVKARTEKNAHGEDIIVSYYIQNGKRHMTEDVWFAGDPANGR